VASGGTNMLLDDLYHQGILDISPQKFQSTRNNLATAQKYVLEKDFAAIADELSQDFTSLVRAFPFCRLPYPMTWIEFAHLDRPLFANSEIHAPMFQGRPKRVGFLLAATRPDLSAWKAHLFWNLPSKDDPNVWRCNGAAISVLFDVKNVIRPEAYELVKNVKVDESFPKQFGHIEEHPGWKNSKTEIRKTMVEHVEFTESDYDVLGTIDKMRLSKGELNKVSNMVYQLARSDWAGETAYLLAVIGLMNTRNLADAVPADLTKLNKSRVRRGRPAFFEHHTLKIRVRYKNRPIANGGTHHESPRGHYVTGHWKVRKSGIYFWKPFARGDFGKGKVTKEYIVT
jgi:hypothetical protein